MEMAFWETIGILIYHAVKNPNIYNYLLTICQNKHIKYIVVIKGNLWSKTKLNSNERAWKMQKNEPSLTSMGQMVLKIFYFKVRNLSNVDIAIL